MKKILFLLFIFPLLIASCTNAQTKEKPDKETAASIHQPPIESPDSTMTDPRDGEKYTIITIGKQTWMAENVRYATPEGSMFNPINPSNSYGRLYTLKAAQNACPEGWHIPTDSEWDELEIAHGMPTSFIGKGGWRGKHAINMRSTTGWDEGEIGKDSLGFNVLPAGYYFSGELGGDPGMQGIGFSAAFWSAIENGRGWARFLFGVREFVNKWDDSVDNTGSALSCRCVKNL